MHLSDLASLAGAVSAVAVLVSLVFLNLQVRTAQKNQRALIQQGRAGRTADIVMRLMEPEFAEVYYRGMKGDANLSEAQFWQFTGYCRAVFLGVEDSFLQHKDSLLDEMAFTSVKTSLRGLLIYPGMQAMWQMIRELYEPEFVAFVDKVAVDAAKLPRVDLLARWKVALEKEAGQRQAA